ncbi:hypothetical protein [Pseudalkalibacillus caeni]|uniref:Uncharacterized protein n=1 Tax=Exobacillus caeni TaxID=2574798 RepID=A0A5R9EZ12_9BACL|nr:hypothetical protein [Pseudalkalibacillus caeni]TLS36542.1 hypothetical protein FCL54_15135 [Pseudalkalibacillus caeni]
MKKRSWLIPILMALFLISLVFVHQLSIQKQLPSEGWSKTVTISDGVKANQPFIIKGDSNWQYYIQVKDAVKQITVDERLNKVDEITVFKDLPSKVQYWTDGNKIVYLNEGDLIEKAPGTNKETVIDSEVMGLSVSKHYVAYWKNHKAFGYIPSEDKSHEVAATENNIMSLSVSDAKEDPTLLINTKNENLVQGFIVPFMEEGSELNKIFELPTQPGEYVSNFQLVESNDRLSVYYNFNAVKQGNKIVDHYVGDIDKGAEDNKIAKVKIVEEETGYQFQKPSFATLTLEDGQKHLYFSATGLLSPKRASFNVYEAVFDENSETWKAERRSSTENSSYFAYPLSNEAIVWLDKQKDEYLLAGTSQNEKVIESSLKTSGEDYALAGYYTMFSLTGSAMMLLFVAGFLIGPGIFLFGLFAVNISAIENERGWVRYVTVGLFLITVIIFLPKIVFGQFSVLAPEYLAFQWNGIVIPIIIAVVSHFLSKAGENEDWTLIQKTFYELGLNALFIVLLFGPYII